MTRRWVAPLWLMGLTNSVFGMYGGIILISVPQMLSIRHVPETTIAAMTAVMVSPGFWTFLVSPILDVRFSRRWYSVVSAALAAALLVWRCSIWIILRWLKVCLWRGTSSRTYTKAHSAGG